MRKGRDQKGNIEEIEQQFERHYPAIQYHFVQFISEHIADCSREFKGDLQQVLILAVIGQVLLQAYLRAGQRIPDEGTASISASRLADVCGIPRETVRRKLKLLEQRGVILRDGDQSWSLTIDNEDAVAKSVLSGLDQRGLKRLAHLYTRITQILQDASKTGGDAGS